MRCPHEKGGSTEVSRTVRNSISVRHNCEMAHRLYRTSGLCEQIHGHSWDVHLRIYGEVNSNGMLAGINFTDLKREFRRFLDTNYDHRVLLNSEDPWAQRMELVYGSPTHLPGLQTMDGDPTTENFAAVIGGWYKHTAGHLVDGIDVTVWETSVNRADWAWRSW